MKIHGSVEDDGLSQDVLAEAMELYTTAAQIFAGMLRAAKAGEAPEAKDVVLYAGDIRKALQSVINERATVEKLRKQDAGIVHDYALDFAAARDEIGRRLACLRDAGGG